MNPQPQVRFSSRAPYYHQHRPRYPKAVIDLLASNLGFTPAHIIADIGAGTGISSELFLNNGNTVYAVEPNADMRAVAATEYGSSPRFHLNDGSAEATKLPDASIDFVVAGQAYHWFDKPRARVEFARILKPGGWVVLFWNQRPDGLNAFADAYNAIIRQYDVEKGATSRADDDNIEAENRAFFTGGCVKHKVPNPQTMTYETLQGRMLSASYMPLPGHPDYEPMIAALRAAFDAHQVDGVVTMPYQTDVYWGQLS